MVQTYVAAIVTCAASLLVGRSFLSLAQPRSWSWLEPGVGFALLIGVGGAVAWASGSGVAASAALLGLVLAAAALWRRSPLPAGDWGTGALVCGLLLGALAVPFLAAGHWGLLGSPQLHLQLGWAEWLRGGPPPPAENVLGPEALADALGRIPGLSTAQALQGELFAIVVLSGLTAIGAIGHLGAASRVIGSCMVALAYMSICFFASAAAWTTAEALFVLTTAVALFQLERERERGEAPEGGTTRWGAALAVALGAGVFFSNSVAGLVWPAVIVARSSLNRPEIRARLRPRRLPGLLGRPATVVTLAAAAALALLAVFAVPFGINHLATAASSQAVAPAAGLGVWPHGGYALEGGYGLADWLATLLAGTTVLIALLWWLRRHETAIPVAFGVSSIIYLLQPLFEQQYSRAQALAIVAPLAMLIAVRPLLEELGRRRLPGPLRAAWALLAVLFIGAAAYSSALALTQAEVDSQPTASAAAASAGPR